MVSWLPVLGTDINVVPLPPSAPPYPASFLSVSCVSIPGTKDTDQSQGGLALSGLSWHYGWGGVG